MGNKLPVSVFIIAVNEGDRIARAIRSVREWADEVIVIDSGSRDDTVAVSEREGARTVFHAWPGYGPQKRFGEEQCRNDWLLNIDADEEITPELAEEIKRLFAAGEPTHAGYRASIVEILPGESRPGRFAHRVVAIRLYDRRQGRFHDSTVHDTVRMEKGTAGQLAHIIAHRSSRGLTHSIDKLNRYSTMQAEDMAKRAAPFLWLAPRLVLEFPAAFLKAYLLRGYCLKGMPGFVNSVMYAFSRFARLAKYWERTRR